MPRRRVSTPPARASSARLSEGTATRAAVRPRRSEAGDATSAATGSPVNATEPGSRGQAVVAEDGVEGHLVRLRAVVDEPQDQHARQPEGAAGEGLDAAGGGGRRPLVHDP